MSVSIADFWFVVTLKLFFKVYLFISGCAGSLLLHGLFPCCCEGELLSGCGVRASHYGGSHVSEHRL